MTSQSNMVCIAAMLKEAFKREELVLLGVVSPEIKEDYARYEKWLSENLHGSMAYLEKNRGAREDVNRVLEGTKSVLVFALPYGQTDEERDFKIARYARFSDYHKLLRERGERAMEAFIHSAKLKDCTYRVIVDSAPVLERAFARKTGAGFIGKNTCFISPDLGSFLLLGEVLTTCNFPIEEKKEPDGCQTCTLCQVECPTNALSKDYQIDATRCLAYWTIEHRGTIPREFWPYLKDYVFGCDICQTVCPFNKESKNVLPKSIRVNSYPGLLTVATMTQADYEQWFGGTPLTRAKKEGLQRNALIALAVSNNPSTRIALDKVRDSAQGYLRETCIQVEEYLDDRDK